MSAVAEKESGATFGELEDALEQKRAKLGERSAKLVDLVAEEQAALDEFLRLTPDKNPWTVGTKPQRRHDEVIKIEREIANLEREIGALVGHVTREGALRDVENLKAKTERMDELNEASAGCIKDAGEDFARFVLERWNPLAELLEQRAALRTEVTSGGTLRTVGMLSPEIVSAWEQTSVAPEGYVPLDVGAFLRLLVDVCLDPRNEGHRSEKFEIVNTQVVTDLQGNPALNKDGEQRVKQSRTLVDSGPRKYGRVLAELVPDRRGQDRRVAEQAGGVSTFAVNVQPGSNFTLS